ncbi:BON domain-containing protein [Azoarcus olearius]|uniref:Hypothetical secreted protein n=1 Tax=Azoarcus sp. (strain BH72) TaxID=418699 RepID=A1K6A9_AZOSB|nr:BON domain-containing protein [Azoarcus olearius]CAL94364.1 hypothetical secreted protein [Azoarcus olearius]
MNQPLATLGALALGATAMYYLDPDRGRARRAEIGQRGSRLRREARHRIDTGRRRTRDGMRGLYAETAALGRGTPPDEHLATRLRARLGRSCTHPGAIHLEVHGGAVVLRGHVLAHEANGVIEDIALMPGVSTVEDKLQRHLKAGQVPQLQGEGRLRRSHRLPAPLMAALWSVGTVTALALSPRLRALWVALSLLSLASGARAHRPDPQPNPAPDPVPEHEPNDPEDIPLREPEPEPEPATAEEIVGGAATSPTGS